MEHDVSDVTAPTTGTVTLAQIREEPLSVDEVLASVQHPACGGITVFVGVVRDHDRGQGVVSLDYSVHPTALARMSEVADVVAARSGAVRVAALHRSGHLEVGDIAVVVPSPQVEHLPETLLEPAAQLILAPLKADPPGQIVVDLSAVRYFGSAFITFLFTARPLLLKLQGATELAPRSIAMRADFAWPRADRRREFLRVRRNAGGGLDLFEHQGSGVLTSKSLRRLSCEPASSPPSGPRSPERSTSASSSTRAFSVTTWRARRRTTSSIDDQRSASVAGVASRRERTPRSAAAEVTSRPETPPRELPAT